MLTFFRYLEKVVAALEAGGDTAAAVVADVAACVITPLLYIYPRCP